METIKGWKERMAPDAPAHDCIPAMLEEITDLRAALAQRAASKDSERDAALTDAANLVHERLKDIRHLFPCTHASALAREALPGIRAIIAAMAAQQSEKPS